MRYGFDIEGELQEETFRTQSELMAHLYDQGIEGFIQLWGVVPLTDGYVKVRKLDEVFIPEPEYGCDYASDFSKTELGLSK